MKQNNITWSGVFKGIVFVIAIQISILVLVSIHGAIIYFDKIENFGHWFEGSVAGFKNAWPIMLVFTCSIFFVLVGFKFITWIRGKIKY